MLMSGMPNALRPHRMLLSLWHASACNGQICGGYYEDVVPDEGLIQTFCRIHIQ